VNASGRTRWKWAAWSHSYFSGDESGGDECPGRGVDSDHVSAQSVPRRCGGASDVYDCDLGRESLSGSPSSSIN